MTSIGRILLSDNTSNHSQIIVVKANCLKFMWRKTLARIWGTYERCAGVVATQPSRQNLVITVAKRSIGTEGGRCRRRRQTWHECLIVEWTWRCQVSVGWSSNPEWRRTYLYPDRTASLRVPKIPSRQKGPSRRQKRRRCCCCWGRLERWGSCCGNWGCCAAILQFWPISNENENFIFTSTNLKSHSKNVGILATVERKENQNTKAHNYHDNIQVINNINANAKETFLSCDSKVWRVSA